MFSLSGQNKPDIDGEEQETWDIQVVQLLRWMEGVRWIKEALYPGNTPPPPENPLMEHLNILTEEVCCVLAVLLLGWVDMGVKESQGSWVKVCSSMLQRRRKSIINY